MLAMETGYRASWRRLVGWVDGDIFRDVNIADQESYQAARLLSEHILAALHTWYYDMYMQENFHAYVDIDLKEKVGEYIVTDTIDVIQSADPVSVTVFTEVGADPFKMYNDFVVRGRGWLTARSIGTKEVSVRVLGIGPRGGLTSAMFRFDRVINDRFEKSLAQIVASIGQGIDYPSRTEACDSCSFFRRCRL
jgi:hypothetical protein